jgi:hypothetical protein
MTDILLDGNVRVDYLPACVDISAPTVAEYNAGTRLDSTMTPDGLMGFEADTTGVDNSKLSSTYTSNRPGRVANANVGLRLFKQTGSDTIHDLLVYGTEGFIAIRRSLDADTAPAAAQKVQIFPIACGETKYLTPAPNEYEKYEVPLFVHTQPQLRATVAA